LPEDTYPVYDKVVNDEDGIAIYVDSVKYKANPESAWQGQKDSEEVLGYAGEEKTRLYLVKDDEPMNFLFVWDSVLCPYGSYHEILLYREGMPEPSGESIDLVTWTEYDFTGDESEHYGWACDDKDVIVKLFDVWESGKKTWEYDFFPDFRVDMLCSSTQVPGAFFDLFLVVDSNREVMMGTAELGCTEVPIELLEEISGRDIDVEKWLN
jgi:hypothetical protein